MLFQVDREKKVILNPDAVKICPVLKDISEQDLFFILLAYDYHGPYKQFPEEERFRKASKEVYGKVSETKLKALAEAIEAYRSLQYDTCRETVINYKKKIVQMNQMLMDEASPRLVNEISKSIEHLMDRCEAIQKEVDRDEQTLALKGGGSLTYIEKFQANRKLFEKSKENSRIVEI